MNLEELGHYDGHYRGLEVPQCGTPEGTHACAVERWISHIGPGTDATSTFRRLGYRVEGIRLFMAHGFYTIKATTAEDAFKIVRYVEQVAIRELDPARDLRIIFGVDTEKSVVTPHLVIFDDGEITATHNAIYRRHYTLRKVLRVIHE
jgi:hypothetical protein